MNYDALDPGIRDVVRRLNDAGFTTTDSGDGVSKQGMECAIDVPNVACRTTTATMFTDADRLATVLDSEWAIQASYDPRDGSCVLLATLAHLQSSDAIDPVEGSDHELTPRVASSPSVSPPPEAAQLGADKLHALLMRLTVNGGSLIVPELVAELLARAEAAEARLAEVSTENSAMTDGIEFWRLRCHEQARLSDALRAQLAEVMQDARRYRRLRIFGVPKMTKDSEMMCFQNLDSFVDADIKHHPSRGEASPLPLPQPEPKIK